MRLFARATGSTASTWSRERCQRNVEERARRRDDALALHQQLKVAHVDDAALRVLGERGEVGSQLRHEPQHALVRRLPRRASRVDG